MVLDIAYTMTRIHKVWNVENKESRLFTEYIITWLKRLKRLLDLNITPR